MTQQRRIGYWLKELDRLVDERFAEDLAAGGLSRRHWQMLHSLADGPRPADEVRDGLAPFWTDPAEWEIQLAQLVDRGLVVDEAGTLALTDSGRATHEEAFARIGRRRRAMVDGITDEQYVETVRILEKMAANMAGDMNSRVCAAPVHIAM
jgi:DNA-binding MarR family transcriptional regulator